MEVRACRPERYKQRHILASKIAGSISIALPIKIVRVLQLVLSKIVAFVKRCAETSQVAGIVTGDDMLTKKQSVQICRAMSTRKHWVSRAEDHNYSHQSRDTFQRVAALKSKLSEKTPTKTDLVYHLSMLLMTIPMRMIFLIIRIF